MFSEYIEWCVVLALLSCNTVLHVVFRFDCGDGRVFIVVH